MKRCLCYLASTVAALSLLAQNDSIAMHFSDAPGVNVMRTNLPTAKSASGTQIYYLKPVVDIPIVAIGAGWSAYAFSKIYSKPHSLDATIVGLDKSKIDWFDRWAVRPFSTSVDRISYYPFFAAMPLPLIFLTGKSTSKDFFKLTFMWVEAMSVTGFLYTGSVDLADRYRPYAYSDQSTLQQRTRGGAKNSFYAGHVALVATSSFFMAKVYADYHPDSKIKWLFYSIAGAATATTGYLRYRAGQHFPSDILSGMAQGTLTGLLVPSLHKHKLIKDPNLSIQPYGNGRSMGLTCMYVVN